MWSDFNEANREAMLKSELISWPVTMAILVLAFGSLVAAGLPLMLTIVGLVASAGVLYLGTLVSPISIWAMNFALMFALALGIDYALFVVVRFRGAHFGQELSRRRGGRRRRWTPPARRCSSPGLTVLVSLSAVMLVPSPAFRSMSLGIMVSVLFVLAATLTLLPAVLAKLGPRVDTPVASLGRTAASTARRASPAGASCSGGGRSCSAASPSWSCWSPGRCRSLGLRTGMPSIKVVPRGDSLAAVGYEQIRPPSGRARRARCRSSRRARRPHAAVAALRSRPRHRRVAAAPAGRAAAWR